MQPYDIANNGCMTTSNFVTQSKTTQDSTAALLGQNKELGDLADDAKTTAMSTKEVAVLLETVATLHKELAASNATISTIQTDNARLIDALEVLNIKYNEAVGVAERQRHLLGELRPLHADLSIAIAENDGLRAQLRRYQ